MQVTRDWINAARKVQFLARVGHGYIAVRQLAKNNCPRREEVAAALSAQEREAEE